MGHYGLDITYGPVVDDEVRIYLDGDLVGHIYKIESILAPGRHDYLIHLSEDYRGWKRVTDRSKLPAAVAERIRTHPFHG